MRTIRSRPFALLLLLCLLFGQWAAGAHALSHLPPPQADAQSLDAPDGDGKGASHVCLECVTGHALDFAVPVAWHAPAAGACTGVIDASAAAAASATVWLFARSRAPPSL
jgi:hypothetical protein